MSGPLGGIFMTHTVYQKYRDIFDIFNILIFSKISWYLRTLAYTHRVKLCIGNLKFGEMEFGEMKKTRRIGAIFAYFRVARVCQRQLGFLVSNSGCFKGHDPFNSKAIFAWNITGVQIPEPYSCVWRVIVGDI